MTKQESFKRRVRARMAKTGERYNAARRALLDQVEASPAGRRWASQPEMGDDAVRDATGRGWNQWCDLIDAWPGHVDGHAAVAKWLAAEHVESGWWAQAVTGGWERITGRRLPGQMPDGTFTANKSRTVPVDADDLRAALLDESGRADLFPGIDVTLRSKPTSKAVRLGMDEGVALVSLTAKPDGRVAVGVQHEKLATTDDMERWKFWWDEWLAALAGD